jgi:hypothetical protein
MITTPRAIQLIWFQISNMIKKSSSS